MTEPLSPAAQAVLDAFSHTSNGEYIEGVWIVNEQAMLAAALRAAAEVATPIEYERLWKDGRMEEYEVENLSRKKLLAIAAELEGQ